MAKKHPYDGKSRSINFPDFSLYHGFCCIFPYCGKFMGKPMHFPYAKVYHRMGIEWEKKHPYYGKSMIINFLDFPHTMCFVAFSRTVGNLWGNQYISHMLKYTIGWKSEGKKHPSYGKSMIIDFPDFFHTMGFLAFFRSVGNLWGNPYISHKLKYTIG